MFRKTWFWVAFAIIFAGTIVFNIFNFDQLGDFINIELDMNRHQAIEKAQRLADENGWGPEDGKPAAIFSRDNTTKTYIELEHGGTDAFKALLESDYYSPFTWEVRIFEEKKTNEVDVYFTPTGEFYGFNEKIPEDQPGAALPADSVLPIIKEAIKKWNIPIRHFDYLENSSEKKPSGRIDHTITYERDGWRVGEARIRLDFSISGDKLTGYEYYVYVPEGFYDRYSEMRTANQVISGVGTFAMAILYILIGCIGSILYFLRKKLLIWKMPILVGFIIAFFSVFLGSLNTIPLQWFSYDTAVSQGSFIFDIIAGSLLQFLMMWAVFCISFMAAETLTRIAFPKQLRFWKIWSKDIAATKEVGGFTITGLMLVSFFIAYQLILHMITKNFDAWWSPSSSMIDPNILATYLPWFTPIATALQAGFWEECLFRAVPLAGAVVLGRKFGKEKLFLIIAIFVQAIIFGAAHANYPQQPSYARVIELIIPSIAFALLYVNFGLLPAIVMHFAYDAVLMASPVYTSTAKGMFINKIIASLLILTPLWVFVIRRLSYGKWHKVQEEDLNKSWEPPESEEEEKAEIEEKPVPVQEYKKAFAYIIPALGIIAIILWGLFTKFELDVPDLDKSRTEVMALADDYLSDHNIDLGPEWKRFTSIDAKNNMNDKFIWQSSDEKTYRDIVQNYNMASTWQVRYTKFSGKVEDRKEHYYVKMDNDGDLISIGHSLPEHWEGAVLAQDSARFIAEKAIREKLGMNMNNLEFISAEPEKLPNRRDWVFEYKDRQYPLETGEGRINVRIQGDMISNYKTYVHVPEKWKRDYRDKNSKLDKIRMISFAIIGILLGFALVFAIIAWTKGKLDTRMMVITAIFVFVISLIGYFLRLPILSNRFIPSQPYNTQLLLNFITTTIGYLLLAFFVGLGTGFLQNYRNGPFAISRKAGFIQGFFAGVIIIGMLSFIRSLFPEMSPLWPDFKNANNILPILGGTMGDIKQFILLGIFLLFTVRFVDSITNSWNKLKALGAAVLVLTGIGASGVFGFESIIQWLVIGLSMGIILLIMYLMIFRFRTSTAIMAVAVFVIFNQLTALLRGGYPSSMANSSILIILIFALAFYWCNSLANSEKASS